MDLTKFIFEPMCLQVFNKYLDKKEPKSRISLIFKTQKLWTKCLLYL